MARDPYLYIISTIEIETPNLVKAIGSQHVTYTWLGSATSLQKVTNRLALSAKFCTYHLCNIVVQSRGASLFIKGDQTNR